MGLPVLPAVLSGNLGRASGVTNGMRRFAAAAVVLAMLALACGDATTATGPASSPTTGAPPATTTPTTTPLPTTDPGSDAAVRVAITATLAPGPGGGIEACPAGESSDCFGVAVAGDLGAAVVGGEYRLVGDYDGRTLTITQPPEPIEVPYVRNREITSRCEGLTGTRGNDNAIHEAIMGYVATVPDSYAGLWWDDDATVFTVWFTGDDVTGHQAAIAAATGGAPVCVIGGADHPEAELHAAQDQAVQQFAEALAMSFASTDTLRNRVTVEAEHVDGELLAELAAIHPGLEVLAFIEVLEGTIADLPAPQPVHPGDVELVTGHNRRQGGMAALGRFTLGYDAELGCFYFGEDSQRVVPVWPLGFSGTSGSPAQIFDQDGELFATAGDVLEIGGGSGVFPPAGDTCGAAGTWVVNA